MRSRFITALTFLLIFLLVFPDDADARRRRRRKARRPPIINEKKLFERVGGISAVRVLTDDWVRRALADARLGELSEFSADPQALTRFRKWVYDVSCELADGPCQSKDLEGKERVIWATLNDEKFLIFADHLVAACEEKKLGELEKNELVGRWGGIERPWEEPETEADTKSDKASSLSSKFETRKN